jgi:hypothetical protein
MRFGQINLFEEKQKLIICFFVTPSKDGKDYNSGSTPGYLSTNISVLNFSNQHRL